MQDPISLIADLGLPIASGLIMGYFIFLIMRQLMNGLVDEIKTIQGISKMLITRASIMNNDMILRLWLSNSHGHRSGVFCLLCLANNHQRDRPGSAGHEGHYHTLNGPAQTFGSRYDKIARESKYSD